MLILKQSIEYFKGTYFEIKKEKHFLCQTFNQKCTFIQKIKYIPTFYTIFVSFRFLILKSDNSILVEICN